MQTLLLGNCLDTLKTLDDNSIDSVVCDPPYGLSFMSKAWDYQVPSVDIWREALRVLKPGGHLLAFGGTRTYHRLVVAIEDAGFEIRDQIQWLYGQGFPKSMDISKALDKEAGAEREVTKEGQTKAAEFAGKFDNASSDLRERRDNPTTDAAKQWSGWGTALKPANEPICLARKPLSEKTVAKNVLKHGTGGLNIDASRVNYQEGDRLRHNEPSAQKTYERDSNINFTAAGVVSGTDSGRFPSNVILDESAAEVLDGQSGVLHPAGSAAVRKTANGMFGLGHDQKKNIRHEGSGGASRFFQVIKQDGQCDQNDLLTATLAEPSSKHDDARLNSVREVVKTNCNKDHLLSHCLGSIPDYKKCTLYQDLASLAVLPENIDTTLIMRSLLKLYGSAHLVTDENIKSEENEEKGSIEFDQTKFIYQAKASKKDRNTGLEGSGLVNNHSTVKPIKLMEYLIKLVTPEGGIVLDPFMGSGTTGVAAKNLGFQFVGCELDENYFNIASSRIGK